MCAICHFPPSRRKTTVSVPFNFQLALPRRVLRSHCFKSVSPLSWHDKVRTAWEIYRAVRPGGELHLADWGRSTEPLMCGAFMTIQLLDGFRNTQDNVEGRLIEVFQRAGFSGVRQQRTFSTVLGTMALYSADRGADARHDDNSSQRDAALPAYGPHFQLIFAAGFGQGFHAARAGIHQGVGT